MSNIHDAKRNDLIDMFNDTSQYLDDIYPAKKETHHLDIR